MSFGSVGHAIDALLVLPEVDPTSSTRRRYISSASRTAAGRRRRSPPAGSRSGSRSRRSSRGKLLWIGRGVVHPTPGTVLREPVRPSRSPMRRIPAERAIVEPEWIWLDDQRMIVVGHPAGGVPFGYVEGGDGLHDSEER